MTDKPAPKKRAYSLKPDDYDPELSHNAADESKMIRTLRRTINRLQEQLQAMTKNATCIPDPAEVDRINNAIVKCLNSIDRLRIDHAKTLKDTQNTLYTPYADYPPPTLADRNAFIARLQALYPATDDPRRTGAASIGGDLSGHDAVPPHLGSSGKD